MNFSSASVTAINNKGLILLVDDNEEDILLIKRALEKGGIRNPLFTVQGGEESIDYLSSKEYPFPVLIVLDLKMPRVDGFDVLQWIRSQPELVKLRVVVLTTSGNMRDVTKVYQLGATSFLQRPFDFGDIVAMTKSMAEYWLKRNITPTAQPVPLSSEIEDSMPPSKESESDRASGRRGPTEISGIPRTEYLVKYPSCRMGFSPYM